MIAAVRTFHTMIALVFIGSIVVVYYTGLAGTVDVWFYLATGALAFEGIVIVLARGNCPLGGLHRRYGDEKGFFELFMPKRVARHMFSFFFVVTIAGYVLVLLDID
jgi:hypothetical protein